MTHFWGLIYFVGHIETKAKKTLHFHAILYLVAFHSTCKSYENSFSSYSIKQKIVKYIDSIFSTSTPFDTELEAFPKCRSKTLKQVTKNQRSCKRNREELQ